MATPTCSILWTQVGSHTRQYLVDVFRSQVEKVEEDWGVSICSVVTDSLAETTAWRRSSLQLGFDKRLVEVALSLVSGTSSSGGLGVSGLLDILMAIFERQWEWKRQESWLFCTGN